MTYCAVKGCHNSSHNHQKHLKIPFHGFPSDPLVAARWIEIIRLNRKETTWKPTKHTKICSVHFNEKEKYRSKSGLCKLRQGAVPTKGLHIFCTEDSQNSDDDLHEPQETDKPNLSASSNENACFDPLTTSSSRQKQAINDNEALASKKPISQKSDTEFESNLDTPRNSALRRLLSKNVSVQRKQSKKIKILQQKVRRLKKKMFILKQKLIDLRK